MLPPGSPMPTETTLMAESGLSRPMVREALALLRAEGLIYTEQGRGSFVRPQLPVRRLGSERYRADQDGTRNGQPATSFTADQGVGWADYTLDREYREVPADLELADHLAVPIGTPLLERRFVFRTHGQPQQMSTSYLILAMVAGTPVADPDNEPWPGGNIAQLRTLGVEVTRVEELVRARMPMTDEAETLRIQAGVPVIVLTRRMLAGDRPVEVAADIVIPSDRVELFYVTDL